ncbi:hypothetical protein AWN73_20185 [Clostridium butyricum]|uniref:Uncharacterized protein n=1 Tax=Clostridium butyricum TaxID=1492 RepID=A0A2S7F538_CLOBU|nr:hypothetical protein [Clostridium butyricum]PPV11992.1 hypothetical protein AWN73_20185 [Clostridium butyricum]
MNLAFIKILGQIDKVLKEDENGSATVLFKIDPESKNLNTSIAMVEFKKKHWDKIKNSPKDLLKVTLYGRYDLRLKNNKPFMYVRCESIRKIKQKNIEIETQQLELMLKDKVKKKKKKKIEKENFNNKWYECIPKEEFTEIDISKVKLVEEIHLEAIIPIFNIKKLSKYEEVNPIAVRRLENGEYGLVTGVRSFLVGKIFDKNLRAYITDLDRQTFKEKYSLEI